MVVIVDPGARAVTAHRPTVAAEVFDEAGTLDLATVVRGFSVSVTALFE